MKVACTDSHVNDYRLKIFVEKSQRLVCDCDQPTLSVQLVPLADESRQISAVKKGSAQEQLNLQNIFKLKLH
ncbi:hypothetical protein T11_10577 [Trichinella zimbabwensis]|uniref:Uncharacterized protein n=2 Tax=Trichinella TaxID=6333 RepID=A0A0V1MTM3_9BILA|nr:hypothetical protein T11_10577 [Trichinella zimbabwensis]KRZ75122.1 hypothetical protein T10_5081 [Trichinella papuae]